MSCHRQPVRKHVQDPRDDLPVLYPRAAHVPVGRPEGLDPLPLLVREFASRHAFSTATDVEVVKPVLPHQHFRQRRGWRVHRRHPRSRSLFNVWSYDGGGPAGGGDRQGRLDRDSPRPRVSHPPTPLPPRHLPGYRVTALHSRRTAKPPHKKAALPRQIAATGHQIERAEEM